MDRELLAMLGLLQGSIRLQDHAVHGAAQGVVSSLGERVHYRGWSHRMLLLLPRLRHPSTWRAGIQHSAAEGDFSATVSGWMDLGTVTKTWTAVLCLCLCTPL